MKSNKESRNSSLFEALIRNIKLAWIVLATIVMIELAVAEFIVGSVEFFMNIHHHAVYLMDSGLTYWDAFVAAVEFQGWVTVVVNGMVGVVSAILVIITAAFLAFPLTFRLFHYTWDVFTSDDHEVIQPGQANRKGAIFKVFYVMCLLGGMFLLVATKLWFEFSAEWSFLERAWFSVFVGTAMGIVVALVVLAFVSLLEVSDADSKELENYGVYTGQFATDADEADDGPLMCSGDRDNTPLVVGGQGPFDWRGYLDTLAP